VHVGVSESKKFAYKPAGEIGVDQQILHRPGMMRASVLHSIVQTHEASATTAMGNVSFEAVAHGDALSSSCVNAAEPEWLEIVKHVTDSCKNAEEWRSFTARARLAKSRRKATPMDKAVVAVEGKLNEHMSNIFETVDSTVWVSAMQDPVLYPTNISDEMRDCLGVTWCPRTKQFLRYSFEQYMSDPSGLYKKYSAWLSGESRAGKSTLMHQALFNFAVMKGADRYMFFKGLDHMGHASKNGSIGQAGAVGVTDFDPMNHQKKEQLTQEEFKGLVDVQEGGVFGCRFYTCRFHKGLPRIFAVNGDAGNNWFEEFQVTQPYACMLRGSDRDRVNMSQQNQHVQATASRMLVFKCPPTVLEAAGVEELQASTAATVAEELERLQQFLVANPAAASARKPARG
jgi:hypothetical protein